MTREWTIDETLHAGQEHLDPERVESYDEKAPFDPSQELQLLQEYGLSRQDTVVDFGAGTGEFALAVASYCERVIAVDISRPMLDVTREKRDTRDVPNIELVRSGFVSYEHEGEPASFVFSKNTLHHLPDFWKLEALKTIAETLTPGGILRLRDLVFSFDPWDSIPEIESWLAEMETSDFTEEELHAHFREEFSTYGFLLEEMLMETGFEILDAAYSEGFYGAYTCRLPVDG